MKRWRTRIESAPDDIEYIQLLDLKTVAIDIVRLDGLMARQPDAPTALRPEIQVAENLSTKKRVDYPKSSTVFKAAVYYELQLDSYLASSTPIASMRSPERPKNPLMKKPSFLNSK